MSDRCCLCGGRGRVDFPVVTTLEGKVILADYSWHDRPCPTCGGTGSLIAASQLVGRSRLPPPPPDPEMVGARTPPGLAFLCFLGAFGWLGFLVMILYAAANGGKAF